MTRSIKLEDAVTGQQSGCAPKSRLQESLKRLHDLNDEVGVIQDRFWYSESVRALPMLDYYSRGELSVLLEVKASVKRNCAGLTLEESKHTLCFLAILVQNRITSNYAGEDGNKQLMFVDDFPNVYGPDGPIPSTVRAYVVQDEIKEFRAEDLNTGMLFAGIVEPTFKLFIGFPRGKFCAVKLGDHQRNRLEPCIVQSAIKVVDGISKDEGEIIEKRRICELMYQDFCSKVRVDFNSGSIGLKKRSDACFDIADMLVGPLDFATGPFADERHWLSPIAL
jgi:hypothetical protein